MVNNIDFELFSILILTVLIIYNFFKGTENKKNIHLFQRMILLDLLMCIAQSVVVVMRSGYLLKDNIIYLATVVNLMCYCVIPYQFLAYVILNIEGQKRLEVVSRYLRVPISLMMIVIFTNSMSHVVFTLGAQGKILYSTGWYILMWVAAFYACAITVVIVVRWKIISVSLKLSAMIYVLLSLTTFIIKVFINQEIMIAGALIALSLIIMQLNLQNPQMIHEAIAQEQEEKLEAIRANKEKSNFLANMSHEIRTPLNVMVNMNEMILREAGNEQIEEYAQRVKTSGEILTSIINNVFDISKLEVGQVELDPHEYKTADLLKELTAIGTVRSEDRHLSFQTDVDRNLPQKLFGDSRHIRQIAMNLIVNAVKYTRHGSILFQVAFEETDQDQDLNLIITIKDTGMGIPSDQINNIFDAFSRGGVEKTTNIEGTGLGLALVKRYTQMMRGTVSVESEYGEGSVFIVMIPQKVIDHTPIGDFEKLRADYVKETVVNTQTFLAPDARLLIVDDNKMNRMAIQSLLKRTRIQIDLAESGESCLEMIQGKHYHVILLDHMMPGMDGIETLHAIRGSSDHQCTGTPVVALTANAVGGAQEMYLAEGFDGYLAKPVKWEQLEETIENFLPPELVGKKDLTAVYSPVELQKMDRYSELLSRYDISLTEGLYYLNGDLEQYCRTARLYLEFFQSARQEIEAIYRSKDLKKIAVRIHALKGNARSLGAIDLYYTARRMEQRCYDGDLEYIDTTIPHLLMEATRAMLGLTCFTQEYEKDRPAQESALQNDVAKEMHNLRDVIEDGRAVEGRHIIDRMLNRMSDMDEAEKIVPKLKQIHEDLGNIEYEQALEKWREVKAWMKENEF